MTSSFSYVRDRSLQIYLYNKPFLMHQDRCMRSFSAAVFEEPLPVIRSPTICLPSTRSLEVPINVFQPRSAALPHDTRRQRLWNTIEARFLPRSEMKEAVCGLE